VEPTGKVFKVHYSHGEPTYVPVPPPPPVTLPYSAAHPFDFLVKKLTSLNRQHNVTPGSAARSSLNPGPANPTGNGDPVGDQTAGAGVVNDRGGSTVL